MNDVDPTAWFERRTWQTRRHGVDELRALKGDRRVAVVLPALNEEATVGDLVRATVPLTTGPTPLVDELVVIDSGSTDRTVEYARAAGARVVHRHEVLPHVPVLQGKGEVLWRSLAATTADVIVFMDSDLVDTDPAALIPALIEPILTTTEVELVKGFYRRPLRIDGQETDTGGGRVTELLARPLLCALFPSLSRIVQPLGGEYAATRSLLRSVPFASGYGVEIGLLIDTRRSRGLDAIAQVNIGVRKHRNRSLLELGVMSGRILSTVLARAGALDPGTTLTQFHEVAGQWLPDDHEVSGWDRPPMETVGQAARTADAAPSR